MKKAIMMFLALVLAAFVAATPRAETPPASAPAPKLLATVLFFNDLHGQLAPFSVKEKDATVEVGGIARVAAVVKKARDENQAKGAKTFVLVAGDVLQGTPMSTVFKGEPDVKCLNAIGVSAMTVGNHEFDFGLDNFLAIRKQAQFPFLSANLTDKASGKLLVDPYLELPVAEGVSLSIIGVTTRDLLVSTKPENVTSLAMLDPVEAATKAYAEVSAKGPVILLSHSKAETDEAIATALPQLFAVIGGHDQILLNPWKTVGKVPIFQAFEKGRYVGRLDLEINPADKTARLAGASYIPITADLPPDPAVAEIVASYQTQLDGRFKEEIGTTRVYLDGDRERIRYEETNLGDFVTDVMREYTGARIALLNAGALRASINQGKVTVEDVFKAMPYDNELLTVELTGAELMQVLHRAVMKERKDEDGGFLHVSGLWLEIVAKAPANVRVGPEKAPLDLEKKYLVAITDFMASGGDGYTMLKGKPATRTGLPLRELLVDHIRKQGEIAAAVEGRIIRK